MKSEASRYSTFSSSGDCRRPTASNVVQKTGLGHWFSDIVPWIVFLLVSLPFSKIFQLLGDCMIQYGISRFSQLRLKVTRADKGTDTWLSREFKAALSIEIEHVPSSLQSEDRGGSRSGKAKVQELSRFGTPSIALNPYRKLM